MSAAVLSLKNVNKSFGPIDVLNDISIDIKAGEVLCLLGDNGAGKSTLIRILSGVHQPTSGTILLDGAPVTFDTPRAAANSGIATVHQFGGTFPLMTIGRSFFVEGSFARLMYRGLYEMHEAALHGRGRTLLSLLTPGGARPAPTVKLH